MQSQQLRLFEFKPKPHNTTIENISNALGFSLAPKWPEDTNAQIPIAFKKNILDP